MKNSLQSLLLFLVLTGCSNSIKPNKQTVKEVQQYFNEIQTICKSPQGKIWNFDLYGPIMFVDQTSRIGYANENGKGLTKTKQTYTGLLPENIVLADKQITWNEKTWNVFVLPVAADSLQRMRNIIMQLFRNNDSALGLEKIQTPDCNHLNSRDNRFWMKIEAEALKSALATNDSTVQKEHIRMALAARKIRKMMTGEFFIRENNLDLKEGLPELTWLLMNGLTFNENSKYLIEHIETFQNSDNFMRSFPYVILPSYGLLMGQTSTKWMGKINGNTDVTKLITEFYQFGYPEDFPEMMVHLKDSYNGLIFDKEENIRERKVAEISSMFETKFLKSPFVMIRMNDQTNLKFDPNQLIPFQDKGTIYMNLTATDIWGTVTVTDGALINTQQSYIYLSAPYQMNGKTATGPDWKMTLNADYSIEPYPNSDKFIVVKK